MAYCASNSCCHGRDAKGCKPAEWLVRLGRGITATAIEGAPAKADRITGMSAIYPGVSACGWLRLCTPAKPHRTLSGFRPHVSIIDQSKF